MTKVLAVVPAAGSGERLGYKTKKPFVLLNGIPMIVRTLKALSASERVGGIITATDKDSIKRLKGLVKKYRLSKVIDVIEGGATRSESVRNCLRASGDDADIILIHDCARALVDRETIDRSIALALKHGACISAVPEIDTVKVATRDMTVRSTPERSSLYRAQTPQVFRRDIIKKAYASMDISKATDDSSLVEAMGVRVKILVGSYRNIKITTKEDLKLAEVLL
jgi:2-C-methyl-D-erythritol 4-phosphate cytidylyltransferase